jgi:NADH-quinone oxidoreductase subunit N
MLAAVMAIFMFSLTGFPLLGGFWGKVYLFTAAINAGWAWLAVIAVINSGVAAFYYLGVIVQMYMRPVTSEPTAIHLNPATRLALGIATAATVILGVWPNLIVNLTTTGFFG